MTLTTATADNLERKRQYADQLQLVGDTPMFSWVDISITDLCNRSGGSKKACVFCPRYDGEVYPNQRLHMSPGVANLIAQELFSLHFHGAVVLCGFGEPMLHPSLFEIVSAFRGLNLEIVTNGDRLSSVTAGDLIVAGVTHIVVSMYDGPEQVDYFKNDVFADIDPSHYTLRDRWHNADEDFGLKLTNRGGTIDVGHQDPVDTNKNCFYPSYSLAIDWNGDVLLCVQDWNKRVRFGNVNSQTLWQSWTSPAMNKRRVQLLNHNRSSSPCNACNADGCLHGRDHAEAWLR